MNLDGSGLTNLTNSPNDDDYSPDRATDGRRISFFSNRDGNRYRKGLGRPVAAPNL